MIKSSLLRPMNLVVPVIGVGIFATTLLWWVPPLTALTYAALVFLSVRDPVFEERALTGGAIARASRPALGSLDPKDPDISPERRVRWLPRGETRQRVEAALAVHRKVVTAIEESDDVTRAVLDDAVPKLHAVAERMVDVAHRREKAAGAVEDLRSHGAGGGPARDPNLARLEDELRAADAEISGMVDSLLTLRARVVRISIESETNARTAAGALNESLDELNLRLEALDATLATQDER
ncbi:MAG: hypothetical protein ACR2JR_06095 [Rubrobacteraceae bacterium]